MNRELKFRAWDGKRMVSPDYITRDSIAYWKADSFLCSSEIVMQYTGLKDKHGVEIYEGDVLSHYDENIEVKYEEDSAGFNICYSICECIVTPDNIEVIGSIYENKELIK